MKRRILAAALCFCMLLGAMSAQVYAAMDALLTKTAAQNEATLAELSELTGGDSEAAYDLLNSLGLLKENGELNISQKLTIDGELFTLEQAASLIADENTDLSSMAEVDGTRISLGELKTMLAIEAELARIKETYFSNREMTGEQIVSLNSLISAIENGRMRLLGAAVPQDAPVKIDLSALKSSGEFNIDADATRALQNNEPFTRSVTCEDCLTVPAGRSISFKLSINYGMLPRSLFTYSLEAFDNAECSGTPIASLMLTGEGNADTGTFEIDNSSGAAAKTVTLRVSINKPVLTNDSSYSYRLSRMLDIDFDAKLSGTLIGMLTFSEPNGCVFSSGASGTSLFNDYIYQKPIVINKDYAFYNARLTDDPFLTWSNGFAYDDGYMQGVASSASATWPLIRTNVTDMGVEPKWSINERMQSALSETAKEIYGSDDSWYVLNAETTLLHVDTDVTNGGIGPWSGIAPVPIDVSGNTIAYTHLKVGRGSSLSEVTSSNLINSLYYGFTDLISLPSSFPNINLITDFRDRTASANWWNKTSVRCNGIPYAMTLMGTPAKTDIEGENTIAASSITKAITRDFSVSVFDETPPTVTSITAPAGSYVSGQRIPIKLTFSEPVQAGECSVGINNYVYTASSLQMDSTGKVATAWYTVKEIDNSALTVQSVENIKDICGNTTTIDNNGGSGWDFAGVSLVSTLMKNAVTGILAEHTAGRDASITVNVKQDDSYKQKYTDNSFEAVVTDTSGATQVVDLTLKEETAGGVLYYTGTMTDLALTNEEQIYNVGVRAFESEGEPGTRISLSGTLTLPPKVNVESISVSSDDPTVNTLAISETYRPTLTFTASPTDASFQSGAWSSSDTDIATVDENGAVVLTGKKVGQVTFTYTADNGTIEYPTDDKSGSITYTVEAGSFLALVIPSNASVLIVRQNAHTTVRWSTNASLLGSTGISCTVKVFGGNYADTAALSALTPVWRGTAAENDSSMGIPENILSELSQGMTPAYTVLVSAPNPVISGDTLKALAHIVVHPLQATAHLTRPESLYITDNTNTVNIGWSIDNFISVGATPTDASLKITRVSGDSTTTDFYEATIDAATGSYTMAIPDVATDSLKETYMVTLSAKNQGDEVAHIDAFPLYVYNSSALKLEYANGDDVSSPITINNDSIVAGYTSASQSNTNSSATADLLALREKLGLIEYIGINYDDYEWSQIADRIGWRTSEPDISVNYKQGSMYEDITLFDLENYLPQTEMAVSSVVDGTATITATHENTGMSARAEVNVSTLRGKFYLFQLTPAIETVFAYTDGKGVNRTVKSNADGVLALYEPDGIASDVSLKAVAANDDVYLGTIYKENLLSGERDATKLQKYPLNKFKLRRVARVELALTKPDGSPFSGELTLRGGVYKNGQYCQDALISGADSNSLSDGKASQSVRVNKGSVTVYLDSTQFWSSDAGETSADAAGLSARDNIQYVFELSKIDGDKYLPMLVYVDGNLTMDDVMRSGESVVSLEEAFAGGMKKPFLSNQYIDYGLSAGRLIDVKGSTGHVGPNATYPAAVLKTIYLLWNETEATGYTVTLSDEYYYVPQAQSSRSLDYPFSSIPAVENSLTLTAATMTLSGWIADGDDMGLRSRIEKAGAVISDCALPFKAIDMTRVSGVERSETARSLVTDVNAALAAPDIDMSGSGAPGAILEFVVKTLDGASGPIDTPYVKMIISPGADNSVFNAFVWAGYNGTGLSEANYSNEGIAVDTAAYQPKFGLDLGMATLKSMAKGEYFDKDKIDDRNIDDFYSPGRHSISPKYQVEGYYEFELRYDPEQDDWTVQTLGGGFTAGIGVAVNYIMNGFAGPVPLTAEFNFKGNVQLAFKAATRYSEISGNAWADPNAGSVTDFLTTLRAYAYMEAFGGFGFDYTLVALKIGLQGGLTIDNSNSFLSREYLKSESARQLNGQQLYIEGKVGVRFVAKLLLISYTATLGSGEIAGTYNFNDWKTINNYWTGNRTFARAMYTYAQQTGMSVTGGSTTLSSRDYLNNGTPDWVGGGSRTRSLDDTNALAALQTNANPDSLPLVSDDGELLLYVSDKNSPSIYDSRVYSSMRNGNGSYPEGAAVADPVNPATLTNISSPTNPATPTDFTGFGDSSLSLDGDNSFAVASWVRMSERIPDKDAGDDVTATEISQLTASAEIVASVWNGTNWSSTRLTVNTMPDIAPAVAVSGDKALVAWRSVYAADPDNATDFSTYDTIQYSIYTADGWSEPKQLYNGSAGAVRGLSAAMLPNGTAAVAYAVERDDSNDATADTEIAYTIINDSVQGATMLATSDSYADENPQITTAEFGTGDKRFVLGWYSQREDGGDIRLLALDDKGGMSNTFPESIAQISDSVANNVSSSFSFAHMTEDKDDLENLTILYTGQVKNQNEETNHSTLNAVRLRADGNGGISGMTSPAKVAELPERTMLDHTCAYISGSRQIKAVLQGTWYDPTNTDSLGAPLEETRLYSATGGLINAIEVTDIGVDYGTLSLNTLAPIQFTVRNAGVDDITAVEITLDGVTDTFNNLSLAPNDSKVFTCYRNTGNEIRNLDYSLRATCASETVDAQGMVYLDYPDIGISKMEVTDESEGLRTVRLTLYNSAAATLAGGKNRSVHIGFYTDGEGSVPANISCNTSGVTCKDNELTISGEDALKLIDEGVYTVEVVYNVGARVSALSLTEIPDGGLRLYANAWGTQGDNTGSLPEFREADNGASVLFESLLKRAGEPVTLGVDQQTAEDGTTALIAIQNNSLQSVSNGAVVATLMDADGNALESKQLSLPNTLGSEENASQSVNFTRNGSRVAAAFGTLTPMGSARLTGLSFDGIPVQLSDFVDDGSGNFTASVTNVLIPSTLVSFVAGSADATVTINGSTATSGTRVSIPYGSSNIVLRVTDGDKHVNYKLSLTSSLAHSTNAGVTAVSVGGKAGAINGTSINVVLNPGTPIPADASAVSITTAEGASVSNLVTTNSGATWTFRVTAHDGKTKVDYTINVVVAQNAFEANTADVVAAQTTIEARNWAVSQTTLNNESALQSWIAERLAEMNLNEVNYSVAITKFVPAKAGGSGNTNGTNGSFEFKVSLSKGSGNALATRTATVDNGVISAIAHVSSGSVYSITASAGVGGSISPSGRILVCEGSSVIFSIMPDVGYVLKDAIVDGVSVKAQLIGNVYTFRNVYGNHTIAATFEKASARPVKTEYYSIEAGAGEGGKISPSGTVKVARGGSVWFYFMPDEGYIVDNVIVDGYTVKASSNSYEFKDVTKGHVIHVTFKQSEAAHERDALHTVTITSDGKGSVSPSGSIQVANGGSQVFTVLPEEWYMVETVYVDGEKRELTGNQLVLDDITKDMEIRVVFTSVVTAFNDASGQHCFVCGWFGHDVSPWCWLTPVSVLCILVAAGTAWYIIKKRGIKS